MADTWFIRKSNGVVAGPISSQQLKQMADEGRIDEHTPISKAEGGPFTMAGNVKGLIPPTATPTGALPRFEGESAMDSVDFHRPEPAADESRARKRARSEPDNDLTDPSYLALWSMAVSAGMIVAMLIYAIAWKFSGPVWAYGTFLIPLGVTLFIVGSFPVLSKRTALNRLAVYVTGAFLILCLIAGLGTIWNNWSAPDLPRRTFENADRAIRGFE